METLRAAGKLAVPVGAILACFLYTASAMGMVDGWVFDHLSTRLATKADIDRVEHKLDAIIQRLEKRR